MTERLVEQEHAQPWPVSLPIPDDLDALTQCKAFKADAEALAGGRALFWTDTGDAEQVAAFVESLGYPIIRPCAHLKIFSGDLSRIGFVVAHAFCGRGTAEIVLASTTGVVTRSVIRGLSRWLFDGLNLRRVTLRIHSADLKSRSYALRIGARPEGVQKAWFADGGDAMLWAVDRASCRWLTGGRNV